nr:MAG TPA: hypothetical protein [Caudoviricetes sp.]
MRIYYYSDMRKPNHITQIKRGHRPRDRGARARRRKEFV